MRIYLEPRYFKNADEFEYMLNQLLMTQYDENSKTILKDEFKSEFVEDVDDIEVVEIELSIQNITVT